MVGRQIFLPLGVLAAGGAPVLMSEMSQPNPPAAVQAEREMPVAEKLTGPRVDELLQIIRFDVTPEWVVQNWSQVMTAVPNLKQHGYRVPVMTGTRTDDLAGSLTYYFDGQHRVARITFHGTTGDYTRVQRIATENYGLERRQTRDASEMVYVASIFDRDVSWLKIRPLSVVAEDQPHLRYKITLHLERPYWLD